MNRHVRYKTGKASSQIRDEFCMRLDKLIDEMQDAGYPLVLASGPCCDWVVLSIYTADENGDNDPNIYMDIGRRL